MRLRSAPTRARPISSSRFSGVSRRTPAISARRIRSRWRRHGEPGAASSSCASVTYALITRVKDRYEIGDRVSNADVFRTYLERFTAGDADGAAELLADEFTFTGPVLQAENKAEFLAGAAALAPIVRGCVVHHQWVDGEQVCSFYDFEVETPVAAGSIPMAEWSVVRGGKLVSSRLVFDTATVTALMLAS